MTLKFDSVYLQDCYTIGGTYEHDGPLGKYLSKTYENDLYFKQKSIEQAEIYLLNEAVNYLVTKYPQINLLISGDLDNQIVSSNYMARNYPYAFLGIFSACATFGEGIVIASSLIDSKKMDNILVSTVSHNMVSEKQFRNPTEYGSLKKKTATFTTTGSAAIILSSKKSKIKVTSVTIGRVIDKNISDVNHMGAVMAPAAADTIYNHLKDNHLSSDYYDLIVTGDLGIYGMNIMKEYLEEVYKLHLSNYNDCGVMLYDLDTQPVLAGGSGPACSALVTFSYLYQQLLDKKITKLLYVPTGALFNPTIVFQKQSIPAIAHAVALEVVE